MDIIVKPNCSSSKQKSCHRLVLFNSPHLCRNMHRPWASISTNQQLAGLNPPDLKRGSLLSQDLFHPCLLCTSSLERFCSAVTLLITPAMSLRPSPKAPKHWVAPLLWPVACPDIQLTSDKSAFSVFPFWCRTPCRDSFRTYGRARTLGRV